MSPPRALGLWLLLAIAATACSEPPAKSPAAGLPSYGAEDASLLDDGFSGHLFATAFTPGRAGEDPNFADRVQRAEGIWLVKVATVALEGTLGDTRRYDLLFRPLATLAGAPPREVIALSISAKDPSFHWLDRVGGAWVGREVLLMVRHYADGDHVVLHFHGEPDSPALRARILQIRQAAPSQK